jgi:hypothetical protein
MKRASTSSTRDFGLNAACFGNDLIGYHTDLNARAVATLIAALTSQTNANFFIDLA